MWGTNANSTVVNPVSHCISWRCIHQENLSHSRWRCLTLNKTWRGVCLKHRFWTIRKHLSLQDKPGKPLYKANIASVPCRTSYQCFCVVYASSTTEITAVRLTFPQPAERVISSVTVKRPTGLLVTVSNYILFLIQSLRSSSRVIPKIYGFSGIKFMILICEYAIHEALKIFCSVLG